MKALLRVIWAGEPAACLTVAAVVIHGAVLLPDWRNALLVIAADIAAGGAVRHKVSPKD